MGELHLEVSVERLRREWKVEAETGPLLVAYRETPTHAAPPTTHRLTKTIGTTVYQRLYHTCILYPMWLCLPLHLLHCSLNSLLLYFNRDKMEDEILCKMLNINRNYHMEVRYTN